jgi:hypothetical protein
MRLSIIIKALYNHSEKSDESNARNTIHGYEAALERITHA